MSGQINNHPPRPDFDTSSVSNEFSDKLKDLVSVNNVGVKNHYTIPFAKWIIGKSDTSVSSISKPPIPSAPPAPSTPTPSPASTIINSPIAFVASNISFESMASLSQSKPSISIPIPNEIPVSIPDPSSPKNINPAPIAPKAEPAPAPLKNEVPVSPLVPPFVPESDSLSNIAKTIPAREISSTPPAPVVPPPINPAPPSQTPIAPPISIDSMPPPAMLETDISKTTDMSLASDFSKNINNISSQPIAKNVMSEPSTAIPPSPLSMPTSSSVSSNAPYSETIKAIADSYTKETATRPSFSNNISPSEASLITGSATSYVVSQEQPIVVHKKPIHVFQDGDSKIESSVPLEYQIKTLESDISSLKMSGGSESTPKTFIPDSFEGAKSLDMADVNAISATAKRAKLRKIIFIIIGILFLIGIGVGGFILARPLLMPLSQNNIIPPTIIEEPVVTEPINPTYFVRTPPNNILDIPIEELNIDSLRNALFTDSYPPSVKGFINTLNITLEGNSLTLPVILSTLLPNITIEKTEPIFEDNFTLFIYRDEKNNIPGFIAKVSPEVSTELLSQFSTLLESSEYIGNLYSGTHNLTPVFEDGTAHNHPIRSALFSDVGYAFNYGWFRNPAGDTYIIAAASYEGMMEAILRAGF